MSVFSTVYKKMKPKWPVPPYDEKDQPHFLFIITPPYSGSTAIAKILDTSPRTMLLRKNGEGQGLVQGLCERDRWKPDKEVNYASVKAVWLNTFQKQKRLYPHIDVVIEKSPPNMMRIEKLSSQFTEYSFIANNRDPYANCSSILYRNWYAKYYSAGKRKRVLEGLAKEWQMRSNKIRELVIEKKIPLLTYEHFCEKPSAILDVLKLPEGVSDTMDLKAKIKVKDYESQPITNQNERQIKNLTDEEIEVIGRILKSDNDLMKFFGYQVI